MLVGWCCVGVMYSGYEAVLQVHWANGKCRSLQPLEIVWVRATCSLGARSSRGARSSVMACSLALVAFLIFVAIGRLDSNGKMQ